MTIESKDELYCHAVPIIKGLEEAGEDMEKTKAQIVVLGQMFEAGDIDAKGLTEAMHRTFSKKAVEEASKICALNAEEILTDAQATEDAVVACEPCLNEALSSILVEQKEQKDEVSFPTVVEAIHTKEGKPPIERTKEEVKL